MTYILIIGICGLLCFIGFSLQNDWIVTIAFCVGICTLFTGCANSDWYQASEKARRKQEALEAQPHVIREVDGCKVYAFKTDRTHYFTRCGANTTTESSYNVSCGKNCTKTGIDVIVTENK